MPDERPQPTQKTQPAKGKPIEIPVPKREEFEAALKKLAAPRKPPPAEE